MTPTHAPFHGLGCSPIGLPAAPAMWPSGPALSPFMLAPMLGDALHPVVDRLTRRSVLTSGGPYGIHHGPALVESGT